MRFDEQASEIVLYTGRRFYANYDILSISDGDVHHGWDGGVDTDDFTLLERCEIALTMIARWAKWAVLG